MSEPCGPCLARKMLAEAFGTYLLVFFGCGSVHTAVLIGAQQGIWQVAIVWGVAIMLAIFLVGGVSGAHINPAMTLAFALWRGFPKSHVGPYLVSQLAGAILGAASLFLLFNPFLTEKERMKGVERGKPGSQITAMCYGEYFPNPGSLAAGDEPFSQSAFDDLQQRVPHATAFFAELLGTAILGFAVFAVTDLRNPGRPANQQEPIFIGLTVAVLISVFGPLTQACFNPARDFGPRLFAAIAGWGPVALPGFSDLSWLTVYIVAPILGGILGGGMYDGLIRPAYPSEPPVGQADATDAPAGPPSRR